MIRHLALWTLLACGTAEPVAETDAPPEPEPACGTATGTLDPAWTTVGWTATGERTDLLEQTWGFSGYSGDHVIRERRVYEAARFDLERPATVHAITVRWSSLPSDLDPEHELVAGLYQDFGHNGFDLWTEAPLWQGSRCAEDLDDGQATYHLAEPLRIEHPGPLFAAHRQAEPGDPVWSMDPSRSAGRSCEAYGACTASVNLYDTELGRHFNGWSFPLPVDYDVQLHLDYDDPMPTSEHQFEQVDGVALGNRSAWGDYDGDGWDDLLTAGPRLLRNDAGHFVDVTAEAGLTGMPGSGGVWGDFDNDGCLDLFLFAESDTRANALLKSTCDGAFVEVTAGAGIVDYQTYSACDGNPDRIRSPASSAAWVDLDADGWLDLYVGNFICWADYSYYVDTVFHNNGDGTFTEITGERGLSGARRATRGVNPVDADGDGDLDLLVSHYVLQANHYFENNGDGTFVERARDAGLAGEGTRLNVTTTYYGHTIGTAWGDLDNDGWLDSVHGNLAHPRFFHFSNKTQILLQTSPGTWTDIAGPWEPDSAAGLRFQETHSVPLLADFNNDGDLDLVLTAVYDGRPTDFYWGRGDGTFDLASYQAGIRTTNGWGASSSDFDGDGRVDLATYQLWRNAGPAQNAIQVRPVGDGRTVNRAGLGATVRVLAGGIERTRFVTGGSGQGNQDSAFLHFGIGEATAIDRVEVTWPGGTTTTVDGPIDAGQRVWIQPDGAHHLGWAPPAP